MIKLNQALKRRRLSKDAGVTVIELLVTMLLFGVLTTVLFSVFLNSQTMTKTMQQNTDLNEESRLVLNRMSRELREAQTIVSVKNPTGAGYDPAAEVVVTFDVDFNGNGTIEPNAADPEEITYRFQPSNKRLLLEAGGITSPILAASVETFKLSFSSKKYECDSNSDGTVTWEELDSAGSPCPANTGNSNTILDVELVAINSITIEFTVLTGTRRQEYRTQLDLRNRAV